MIHYAKHGGLQQKPTLWPTAAGTTSLENLFLALFWLSSWRVPYLQGPEAACGFCLFLLPPRQGMRMFPPPSGCLTSQGAYLFTHSFHRHFKKCTRHAVESKTDSFCPHRTYSPSLGLSFLIIKWVGKGELGSSVSSSSKISESMILDYKQFLLSPTSILVICIQCQGEQK